MIASTVGELMMKSAVFKMVILWILSKTYFDREKERVICTFTFVIASVYVLSWVKY